MKGLIEIQGLRAAVNFVYPLTKVHYKSAFNGTIILSAGPTGIQVQATNYETAATYNVRAKLDDTDGNLIIDATAFREYVSRLDKRPTAVVQIDDDVFFDGRIRASFANEECDDLPDILDAPIPTSGVTCLLNLDRLQLQKVAKFTHESGQGQSSLESIFVEILHDGQARFSATDRQKLVCVGPNHSNCVTVAAGLIPSSAFPLLTKMRGFASMTIGEEFARFDIPGVVLYTTLVQGEFVDLTPILLQPGNPKVATFRGDELRDTLRALQGLTSTGNIRLVLSGNRAQFTCEENPKCSATVPTKWAEDDFSISISLPLLLDVLQLCGRRIDVQFYGAESLIRVDSDIWTMALMPLLQESEENSV